MSSPFVGGWTIHSWVVDDTDQVSDGIPTDGVLVGGHLEITEPSVDSFNLQWPDQSEQSSSMAGLHSDPDSLESALIGQSISVSFGGKPVPCDVNMTLIHRGDEKKLKCTMTLPGLTKIIAGEVFGPDVGSGTFTATASGGNQLG